MSDKALVACLTLSSLAWASSAFSEELVGVRPPLPGMTFLAGEGRDPFRLVALGSCSQAALPRAGELYWSALDLSPDRAELFGISWDELYRIDRAGGGGDRIGPIGYSHGDRSWFVGSATVEIHEPGFTGPYQWYLRAAVELASDNDPLYEQSIEQSGEVMASSNGMVLVDELVDGGAGTTVRLRATLDDVGVVYIELVDFAGAGAAYVQGIFSAVVPNATTVAPIRLPITGFTISPVGQMVALSDAEWDPHGRASLYEIEIVGEEVTAARIAPLDVDDVWSIEFADDGTLYGAGERFYEIDPLTGAATLMAELSPTVIVAQDFASDGRLYGLGVDPDGTRTVYELKPGGGDAEGITRLADGFYWGLAVVDVDPADLDGDGDVDGDDEALFDTEYTGSLDTPYIPPAAAEPSLALPLVAPWADDWPGGCQSYSDIKLHCAPGANAYRFDGSDFEFPGIVVDGNTAGLDNTSATVYLEHDDESLWIVLEVRDDVVQYDDNVELYLDANNSGLPVTEGDPFGFQARLDRDGDKTGDAAALPVWEGQVEPAYSPDIQAWFKVDKAATGLATGGTYGFDLAVRDDDDYSGYVIPTYYFLFSVDTNGWRDERQWGNIYLAPGPLPGQPGEPHPDSWTELVDVNTNLSWTPAPDAATHRVYLGAHPDELVYLGEQPGASYDPGTLSEGWTYYWRIDEVNSSGVRTGPTWAFTTEWNPADVDHDGDVDGHDHRRLFQRPAGDLNGDGVVNPTDYVAFVAALGASVGDPAYDPGLDYDSDGIVSLDDYEIWTCHYLGILEVGTGEVGGEREVSDFDFDRLLIGMRSPSALERGFKYGGVHGRTNDGR
ncbi:MAG: hypothetical protein GY842_04920 [bacterium]|nr:hypothetical protein [bacterium]